eukprot:9338557-Lingulodinium_polyedra.AAC.1
MACVRQFGCDSWAMARVSAEGRVCDSLVATVGQCRVSGVARLANARRRRHGGLRGARPMWRKQWST